MKCCKLDALQFCMQQETRGRQTRRHSPEQKVEVLAQKGGLEEWK